MLLSPCVPQSQSAAVLCTVAGEAAVVGKMEIHVVFGLQGESQSRSEAVPVAPVAPCGEDRQGLTGKAAVEHVVIPDEIVVPAYPDLRREDAR